MGVTGLVFEILNVQVQHFLFPIFSKENVPLEVTNQGQEMSSVEVLNTRLNRTDFLMEVDVAHEVKSKMTDLGAGKIISDETEAKREVPSCRVCEDNEAIVAFKPCGHIVLCKGTIRDNYPFECIFTIGRKKSSASVVSFVITRVHHHYRYHRHHHPHHHRRSYHHHRHNHNHRRRHHYRHPYHHHHRRRHHHRCRHRQ